MILEATTYYYNNNNTINPGGSSISTDRRNSLYCSIFTTTSKCSSVHMR
jgi:hypothetical protein